MRQVPKISKYLLIGRGRLARHWAHYLHLLNVPFSTWNRDDQSTADLIQKLRSHPYCFLCISDNQVTPFFEQFKDQGHKFIHFSGSLHIPGVFGFHPMMTFGKEMYDLETYQSLHFVGTHPIDEFKTIIPEWSNQYTQILPEQKALYHSLCVLSGNGTTLLWDLVQQEFRKIGIQQDAIAPYLSQVSQNIIDDQQGRWTGPWYRKDEQTIDSNKNALVGNSLQELYLQLERLSQHSGNNYEKHPKV